MHRYVHTHNIAHFATMLGAEAEPKKRAVLMKLLVEEEDLLGFGQEDLRDADSRIAKGQALIDGQRALIARLSEKGKNTVDAQSCLVRLIEIQALFVSHRQRIVDRLSRNSL